MKTTTDLPYKKHVLVCVNQRDEGKSCCSNTGSEEVFFELKKWVGEKGLVGKVWVTRTRCMGFCNDVGATIALYPEKKWFLQTKMEDLDKVKESILDGL